MFFSAFDEFQFFEMVKVLQFSSFEYRKDVRGREAVFVSGSRVMEVFLTRYLNKGPAIRANSHDPSGAKTFRHEIRLQADLDSTASHWNVSFRPPDLS